MRALVTGCAGFIGSNLTDKLLEKGHRVIGIDCFNDYYPIRTKRVNIAKALTHPNFTIITQNILNIDMEQFPKVDYVFHLAAQSGVRTSWGRDFKLYSRHNIETTQRLLECYKNRKIQKFVYSSSSSVYGKPELPTREDSLLKPDSPYGVTKLAAENICRLYYENYCVPTICLRYFNVYGSRQRPDAAIYKFVRAIATSKKVIVYGDGEQTRDFTYIDDVVRANLLASETNIAGEIFNIGSGNRVSINWLIEKIGEIIGRKTKIEYTETQKGDARDSLADVNKAKEILNWKPMTKIEEGLRHYINNLKI